MGKKDNTGPVTEGAKLRIRIAELEKERNEALDNLDDTRTELTDEIYELRNSPAITGPEDSPDLTTEGSGSLHNKETEMNEPRNVCVEIPLPDGWMSMYIGKLVERTESEIILVDVSWIASTGRRHLWFAGTPDANAEVEPYPDGVKMSLPASGAVITEWPHALPRTVM